MTAGAADCKREYEAYGLCVVSKLIEYDENFDMNKYVDYDKYSSIISFWFGVDTLAPTIPTNADAVYDMARFVTEDKKANASITKFKDFGFIEKDYRDAYKLMCSSGYLDTEDEYLNPNYPLTYGVFFDLLMNFERNASFNHSFEVNQGTISDSYAENKNIVLCPFCYNDFYGHLWSYLFVARNRFEILRVNSQILVKRL